MDILIKRLKALPCFLVTLLFFVHVINGADPVYSPAGLTDSSGNSIDSAAAVTWADLPSGQPYRSDVPSRVSAGLEPYYGLVHSFINSVFSQGIPTGIIDKAVAGDLGSIANNYSDYVSYFIGYAICVVVGVLFMLIFPLVACCFCCCRCCGNCGGKMKQSEEDADSICKKYVFAAILLVAVTFLTVGMACIYVNNDNTSTTLNSISSTTSKNLGDIKLFVNNTATQASHIARTNFNFMKQAVVRDLDNIEYLVGLPLRMEIETQTNINATLTTAYSLANVLDAADTALADVETKVTELKTAITDLTTALNTMKTNMTAVFTACGTIDCPPASRPNYATRTGVDSTAFPSLTGPRTSMNGAKATNLTVHILDAENELDSIPGRVGTDSLANRNYLKTTLDDLADDIDPMVNQIEDLNSQISGENATIDLDSFSDQIDSLEKTIKQYDQYRWYGGIGLASIVLLVIVMAIFGMIFGVIGSSISKPPSQRGCVSNCGGVFLMWSAAFVFIFSALLMLLTLVTFLIGAPLHRFACVPITDLDQLEELVTIYNDQEVGKGKYFLGNMLLGNDTIALTVTGLLRDCKNGKSALNAFKLDSKFDIDDILNYSKTLDVQKEIDKITVDFSNVTIFPTALNTQLEDLKTAVNISFTEFYVELGKTPTTIDLSTLADSIDAYANGVPYPANSSLQDEAASLRSIETNEYAAVVAKISALNSSVAAMDAAVSNIPTSVDTLTTGLNAADTYIHTNASTVTKSLLNTYVTRILGIVDSYVAYTRDSVYNKMGTCEPVWNTYNSMMVYTLCYNIMDTFNGFWFSLGWCIFFFMFSLIFSVKLAKYFRRMEPDDFDSSGDSYSDKDRFADAQVVTPMPSKPQLWMRNNKVHHSDNDW